MAGDPSRNPDAGELAGLGMLIVAAEGLGLRRLFTVSSDFSVDRLADRSTLLRP